MSFHVKEFSTNNSLVIFVNDRLRLNSYHQKQEFKIVSINTEHNEAGNIIKYILFYLET